MQSRKAAVAVGAALIAAAVVLFIVLQGGSGSPPLTKGVTVIHLKNGEPIGGVHDVTVNKGDRVRVTVDSDIRANVDVHGYDFTKPVKPGGTVSYDFPATLAGEFEMEAHPVVNGQEQENGNQLVELRVNP
jgi:hypothetical protein